MQNIICPSGMLFCVHKVPNLTCSLMQHIHGNILYMFDRLTNPVVHIPLLKAPYITIGSESSCIGHSSSDCRPSDWKRLRWKKKWSFWLRDIVQIQRCKIDWYTNKVS